MPDKNAHAPDQTLHQEHHPAAIAARLARGPRWPYLAAAVLGSMDGCVTTFAVVAGAVGANFTASVAIVMGAANLLADGFSMAISNYEAIYSQTEMAEELRALEQEHIRQVPDGEREEVRQIFQRKGFSGSTLEKIVETVTTNDQLWINTMLAEEHHLPATLPNALATAGATFLSFVVVGTLPLLPLLVPGLSMSDAFALSCVLAALVFFTIGIAKSYALGEVRWSTGLRTLATGSAAATIAYLAANFLERALLG